MSGHLLILAVSVLVAFSAVLSALGFRGRVEVIGIDLGTTYARPSGELVPPVLCA